MIKTVQLVQIDPEELVGLIHESVKSLFNDFVSGFERNNPDEILTPTQVCEILQIDESTLWRWGKRGKVQPYGIGGRRYFKKKELMASLMPLNNTNVLKMNSFNNQAQ